MKYEEQDLVEKDKNKEKGGGGVVRKTNKHLYKFKWD